MANPQREILRLLRAPEYGNRECADCHQVLADSSAVWIVHSRLRFSMFVCVNCAGVHRSLGVHISKVKSISLDTITEEDINQLSSTGNSVSNRVLECYFKPPATRPQPEAERDERELFIRAKHESFAFCIPSADLIGRTFKNKRERGALALQSALPVRLIDYFVTLSLGRIVNFGSVTSASSVEQIKFEAATIDRFPAVDHSDFSLLEHISQFSFPEGCFISPTSTDPEFFSFVLTDVNGVKTYMSCLRFYEKSCVGEVVAAIEAQAAATAPDDDEDNHFASFLSCSKAISQTQPLSPPVVKPIPMKGPARSLSDEENSPTRVDSIKKYAWAIPANQANGIDHAGLLLAYNRPLFVPKSICIVTHYPFFNLSREFLCQLFRIAASNSMLPIERYIGNFVCEVPLPPQGQSRIEMTIGDRLISLSRPPKNQMPMVDFSYRPLFGCLRVDNVLTVVKCLLLECKIILISSHLSIITPVAEALLSFLFPFVWQGAYVPVIPIAMKDMLDAPVPYLVGIHSKYLTTTPQRFRPANSVMVLLDTDEVLLGLDEDTNRPRELPPFPSHDLEKLRSQIIESVGFTYLTNNREQVLNEGSLAFPSREHLTPLDLYSDMLGTTRTVHQPSTPSVGAAGSTLSSSPPNDKATSRGSIWGRKNDKGQGTDRLSQQLGSTSASLVNGSTSSNSVTNFLKSSAQKVVEANANNRPVCCTFVQSGSDSGGSGSAVMVGMSRQLLFPSQAHHFLSSCNNVADESSGAAFSSTPIFRASESRAAFLRFFVSIFINYSSFLESESDESNRPQFNREAFIRDCDESSRAFMIVFLQSQMFEKFLEERQANSESQEILFFDESIIAKNNRSTKTIKKKETRFLDDDSGKIVETFTPPPPSPLGLLDDGSLFTYSHFPRLRYNLFGTIRNARRLLRVPDQQRSVSSPFLVRTNEAVAQSVNRMRTDSMDASLSIDSPRPEGKTVVKSLDSLKIRFQKFLQRLQLVQSVFRGFLVRNRMRKMNRARWVIFRAFMKYHNNKALYKDYLIRDAKIKILQRISRGFLGRAKYKNALKMILVIQSSVRVFANRKKYRHTRACVLRIQNIFRMHRFRVSFLAFRDLAIMIQAVYRGFIQRKKTTSTRLAWIVELRKHLFLLWHQADTSLVYRSKFWVLFDGNSFLNMAVHEDEISTLWESLGMIAEIEIKSLNSNNSTTENPLKPTNRPTRPKRKTDVGKRTLLISREGLPANNVSFSRKLSFAQESMYDRGITLEEVAMESKAINDDDDDDKPMKSSHSEPVGIDSIFSGRISWGKSKATTANAKNVSITNQVDSSKSNRRDSRANMAKARLEEERKLLYQYLKSGDDGVKESLFRSFGIESNKLRKRYLVSRVWTVLAEADISSQVVLTSFKSIEMGGDAHKRGLYLPFGFDPGASMDHSRADAEWVQRKRDLRIRADVLSSIRACLRGIQISWHDTKEKKGKHGNEVAKRRPSVEDGLLRGRLKEIGKLF